MATKQQIGCGLVGYGGAFVMGRLHGQQLEAAGGLKVTAVCDLDPKRLVIAAEDFPGIATYTKVDQLLKDDNVDLCVITLPHNLHGPVGRQRPVVKP